MSKLAGAIMVLLFVVGSLTGIINLGWWMSRSPMVLVVCLVVIGWSIGALLFRPKRITSGTVMPPTEKGAK